MAMVRVVGAMMAAALVAGPAAAKSSAKAVQDGAQSSRIADDLVACKAVAGDAARLACYDRAAAAFAEARDKKQIVVIDREGAKKVKRRVFGFSLPNINLFGGRDDDEPKVTEIDATLTRVDADRYGVLTYYLDDGSVWQTTEDPGGAIPRKGQPIKVKAAILGAYTARIGNGRVGKVKRIR